MYEKELTFNEYQRLAMRTINKDLSPDQNLMNAMLGLAGETGECCDLVKKNHFQDGRDIDEKLFDELGDIQWYVMLAALSKGWTLEDIAAYNIEKLRRRYPEGFDPERSLHRNEEFGRVDLSIK